MYPKLAMIIWPALTNLDIIFPWLRWSWRSWCSRWLVSELFVWKSVTCTCPSCGDLFDLSTSVSFVFFVVLASGKPTGRRCFSSWDWSDRTSPGIGGGNSPLNLPNCGVLLRTSEDSLLLECSPIPEIDLTKLESFNILPSNVISTSDEGEGEGGGLFGNCPGSGGK